MDRPLRRAACAVAVLVAFVAGAPGVAVADATQQTQTIAGTQITPDDVALRVDVGANGTAVWQVEYRVLLDDENTTAAFESVREDIETNESRYTSQFHERMNATASAAENTTGREMAIRDVKVTASNRSLPQEYGVLTYTFVWTNFAVVDDGTIRAGDALEGFFLDEATTLLFSWPEGYALDDVSPSPDDRRTRTVVWNGPLDFGPGEPALSASAVDGTTDSTEPGGTTDDTEPAAGGDSSDDSTPWVVLAGALVVVGLGVYLYRRRAPHVPDRGDASPGTDSTATADADDAPSDGVAVAVEEPSTDEAATAATPTETAGGDADVDADVDADAGETETDVSARPWEDELLSNRERVLALMEHEGGRLRQQEVAQTLDWTDAKTSQVVRKMREEDQLDAFRLGRENVLVLPDEDLEPSDE